MSEKRLHRYEAMKSTGADLGRVEVSAPVLGVQDRRPRYDGGLSILLGALALAGGAFTIWKGTEPDRGEIKGGIGKITLAFAGIGFSGLGAWTVASGFNLVAPWAFGVGAIVLATVVTIGCLISRPNTL